jgi:EAL domain-containing protein (putative c-di-GMP-specific phosphodiesterase class I)
MRTTAEGVETAEQLSHLRLENCDEVQGYLFSRPVAPRHIPQLLERWNESFGSDTPRNLKIGRNKMLRQIAD